MSSDLETILPKCREMLSEQDDIEAVLLFLRQSGYSKMEAVKVLLALKGCGLKDAKQTVHLSRTWQDQREADEQLEEMFVHELIRWAEESTREHSEND